MTPGEGGAAVEAADLEEGGFKRDGFEGERLHIVPRSMVRAALEQPVIGELVVTDCGFFPSARFHRRSRSAGAGESVVIVCTSGRGWVHLGAATHAVPAGHAAHLPAGAPHAYGADPSDPWSIWWMHITGRQEPSLPVLLGTSPERPVLVVDALEHTVELFSEVVEHVEQDDTLLTLGAASGAAWHALTTLALRRESFRADDPVERVKAHLAEHLDEATTIAQLAASVNLSPSHLAALFKTATGSGPIGYLALLRMRRARHLLDSTDLPIAVVASAVGYPDAAYFSRRFSQHHDLSPRQYREAYRLLRSGRHSPTAPDGG